MREILNRVLQPTLQNIYREKQVVDRLNDSEITVNVSSVFLHRFVCLSFLFRFPRVFSLLKRTVIRKNPLRGY